MTLQDFDWSLIALENRPTKKGLCFVRKTCLGPVCRVCTVYISTYGGYDLHNTGVLPKEAAKEQCN